MVWLPDDIPSIHLSGCCLLMIDYPLYTELLTRYKREACVFCRSQIKSRKHILKCFQQNIMATSFQIVFFHQDIKGRRFQMNLCKIAWAATIYHIWLQRKTRIHGGTNKIEGIFKPLQKMLGGGLVFVKRKSKLYLLQFRVSCVQARKQINPTACWQLASYTNLLLFYSSL